MGTANNTKAWCIQSVCGALLAITNERFLHAGNETYIIEQFILPKPPSSQNPQIAHHAKNSNSNSIPCRFAAKINVEIGSRHILSLAGYSYNQALPSHAGKDFQK
ncbi:hairy and enhancer of split-related protein HELT [Platysternon megacephalum]|uniref:Hairy and enhancer of split-related protein HELT n=1 Tax=Platysternon megacephalum TaxID=55544 RepID=A0A4D9F686_9SAUR|nr:hairy and enhancer of split-related protein HELT [Platysternon megacephalum]